MDKFNVGDKGYWLQPDDELEHAAQFEVIDYNPDGFGWLKWVKYKVAIGPKPHTWFLGNDASPDVFCSKVYSEAEYRKELAKKEYMEIQDDGTAD